MQGPSSVGLQPRLAPVVSWVGQSPFLPFFYRATPVAQLTPAQRCAFPRSLLWKAAQMVSPALCAQNCSVVLLC